MSRTEAACEAEQWKQRFHTVETASQQLCTEILGRKHAVETFCRWAVSY